MSDNVIVSAVEQGQKKVSGADIKLLASGVKIRKTKPPIGILLNIQNQFKKSKPKVPVMYMEELGRSEPNEEDPEYQDALEEWRLDYTNTTQKFALLSGAEIVHIPDTLPAIEEDGWLEVLGYTGIDVELAKKEKSIRKLLWLQNYAISSVTEFTELVTEIMEMVNVAESEVDSAVESFRNT